MADLSFANDAGMQDGTGDGLYLDFLYKYMNVVGVSLPTHNPPKTPVTDIQTGSRCSTKSLPTSGLSPRDRRNKRFPSPLRKDGR